MPSFGCVRALWRGLLFSASCLGPPKAAPPCRTRHRKLTMQERRPTFRQSALECMHASSADLVPPAKAASWIEKCLSKNTFQNMPARVRGQRWQPLPETRLIHESAWCPQSRSIEPSQPIAQAPLSICILASKRVQIQEAAFSIREGGLAVFIVHHCPCSEC